MSSVRRRFFSAGTSRVASSTYASEWSKAESTCSLKAGGVSMTT